MNGVRVAAHQSSSRSDRRKLVSSTRSASVAVVSEMAPRWMTASSLRLSSQLEQLAGRHHVGEPALAEVAPLLVAAEMVVDDDVAAPGLVQARDHVRPDESGPAGDQQHPYPASPSEFDDCVDSLPFAPECPTGAT